MPSVSKLLRWIPTAESPRRSDWCIAEGGEVLSRSGGCGPEGACGMEASGLARWFERLLAELQFELWTGDAAEIRTKRVRKQKTDRL